MGSVKITVETTAQNLGHRLRRLARSQLPIATAQALTAVAQKARDEQRSEMPRRFKIRNRRVIQGITIQRAEKADWPKTFALIGTRDAFIARFEQGGVQRPIAGRARGAGPARFAIPTRVVAARRTAGGRIPASLKPRRIIARGGRISTSTGSSGEGIWIKRKRRKTLGGLTRAFVLRRSIKLKKRLELADTVEAVARRTYARVFEEKIRKAIASRR